MARRPYHPPLPRRTLRDCPRLWQAWTARLEQEAEDKRRRRLLREIILGAEARVAHRDLQLHREMYKRHRRVLERRARKLQEALDGLARLQAELDQLEARQLVLRPPSPSRPR